MRVWVDADNCSLSVRHIIERAAERRRIATVFAAAVRLPIRQSGPLSFVLIRPEDGTADDYIKARICPGDLVITADIPLAYDVVGAGAVVINPRGDMYTRESVGERKSLRDFMAALRAEGFSIPAAKKRAPREAARAFAGLFDKALTRLSRGDGSLE